MNDQPRELPPIQEWVEHLCMMLEVDSSAVDLRAILDMTRDVAHHVDRPAAPVSAFIVGMAAARHGGGAEAVAQASAQAAHAARVWSMP